MFHNEFGLSALDSARDWSRLLIRDRESCPGLVVGADGATAARPCTCRRAAASACQLIRAPGGTRGNQPTAGGRGCWAWRDWRRAVMLGQPGAAPGSPPLPSGGHTPTHREAAGQRHDVQAQRRGRCCDERRAGRGLTLLHSTGQGHADLSDPGQPGLRSCWRARAATRPGKRFCRSSRGSLPPSVRDVGAAMLQR